MASGTAVGGGISGTTLLCSSALTVSGTGGAILVVVSSPIAQNNNINSVTDGTNTYTQLAFFDDTGTSGEQLWVFGAKNVAAGNYTPQANFNNAPGDGVIAAVPLNGRDTTAPFGTVVSGVEPSSTTITMSSVSTAAGDDVIAFLVDTGALESANEYTAVSPFIERGEFGNPGTAELDAAVHAADNQSAGSITPTATQANGDRTAWFALPVAAAAASGGPVLPPLAITPQYQAWIAQ